MIENKVYEVSQGLADYVRSSDGTINSIKNELPWYCAEEIVELSITKGSYRDGILALWYADKYGYMKVKKPELYYVHFIENDELSYLSCSKSYNNLLVNVAEQTDIFKTKFTLDEIKAIDERYLQFAERVEE